MGKIDSATPDDDEPEDQGILGDGQSREESESAALPVRRDLGDNLGPAHSGKLTRRALAAGYPISDRQRTEFISTAHDLFTDPSMPSGIRLGMGKLLMEANRQSLLAIEIAGRLNPAPSPGRSGQAPVNLTVNVGGYSPEQLRALAQADRIIDVSPDSAG